MEMINEVARQVLDQIRDSATRDETVAAKLHDEAKGFRQQAEAYEARATNAEANALIFETGAQIKRQFTALLAGQPGLPTPGAVVPIGELGMGIGAHKLAPPENLPLEEMTAEQVTSIRDLMEAVYGLAFDRVAKANEWLRQHRSTVDTAVLELEDIPAPDPLTATPAEAETQQAEQPAEEPEEHPGIFCHRNVTYDLTRRWRTPATGEVWTFHGDWDRDEWGPFPLLVGEDGQRTSLRLLAAAGLEVVDEPVHIDDLTADGEAATEAEGEGPGHGPEPEKRPGRFRVSLKRHRPPNAPPAAAVEAGPRATTPDVPAPSAVVEEPRTYPEEPTVPAAPVHPEQARLDELAARMAPDTEAFARVPGDGDSR
jgi:hypothetical protein